jgi:nicotinamidase-related amidase
MNKENTLLLTVDIQEKLLPVMNDYEKLLDKAKRLIAGAKALNLPRLYTQQYTQGIGMSVGEIIYIECGENSEDFEFIEKSTFSVMGEDTFKNKLASQVGIKNVIVSGIEAHICVQQSVLDLIHAGYNVCVVADVISSRSVTDSLFSIARMEKAGATITTMEAVLFELTKTANHPRFREISKIIK